MTKFTATIASAAAALLLAGNAVAQMPASGEGPLFLNEGRTVSQSDNSQASRPAVNIQQVAAGEMNGVAPVANDVNQPTRAEVRQETRDAFANGQRPAIGNRS